MSVLLGALAFALRGVWLGVSPDPVVEVEGRPVVVPAARVLELASDFADRWGTPPSHAQLQALVDDEIDDDLLEREARRLALDFGDRAVRRRLVQKMRAVAADPTLGEEALYRAALELGLDDDVVIRRHLRQKMRLLLQVEGAAAPLTEAELAAGLERHRERFLRPGTVTFSHIFSRAGVRGSPGAERAVALAAELRARPVEPAAARALSDPFPLALRLDGWSQAAVARRFGADFAAQLTTLEPGQWSSPIASPFGLHLVWVHESSPETPALLSSVRGQVARILAEERRDEALRQGLARLRLSYRVDVEWPAEIAGAGTGRSGTTIAEAGP